LVVVVVVVVVVVGIDRSNHRRHPRLKLVEMPKQQQHIMEFRLAL
jgi:hypothetical protein